MTIGLPRFHRVFEWFHLVSCVTTSRVRRQVDPVSVQRARSAIRRGEFHRARVLLSDWDETVWQDSPCLNVFGVLAVSESDWKKATRLWQAAVRADANYPSPRQNLRRHFVFFQFGRSDVALALGDEPECQMQELRAGHDA